MTKDGFIVGKNGVYILKKNGEIEIVTEENKTAGKPKVSDKLLKAIKTALDQKKDELERKK